MGAQLCNITICKDDSFMQSTSHSNGYVSIQLQKPYSNHYTCLEEIAGKSKKNREKNVYLEGSNRGLLCVCAVR